VVEHGSSHRHAALAVLDRRMLSQHGVDRPQEHRRCAERPATGIHRQSRGARRCARQGVADNLTPRISHRYATCTSQERRMTLLIVGLALFFVAHAVPMFPARRTALVAGMGPERYKGVFSAASGLALVMIVVGYAYAGRGAQWFAPSPAAHAAAPFAMIVVFILLAATNSPSHIRAAVKHPMLIAL